MLGAMYASSDGMIRSSILTHLYCEYIRLTKYITLHYTTDLHYTTLC